MSDKKNIILGVTGSIAAYKAAELVCLLVDAGHEVHVVMTRSATEFVGEVTFRTLSRNPVGVEMFEERVEWSPEHIGLADDADLLLVAPCTANVIAKFAIGLADDLLSSIALATPAPVMLAPAMNGKMWEHPATQANVATLRDRGVHFVGPDEGDLACGYQGVGKMSSPEAIAAAVADAL